MTTRAPLPLTPIESMIIAVVATECFNSMDIDGMTTEMTRGALLLFDSMIRRVEPHMPHDADRLMPTIRANMQRTKLLAAATRALHGLPPVA